ncbi:Rv2175c family DNA-binding protein [Myceligenerans crystallogenes]|uniref:Rv2175c family DNA-binding protein n=1 Tax=Myceligenerans crystallogenes TaxID=316335 RepID=A0ABN2NJF4_9MICO
MSTTTPEGPDLSERQDQTGHDPGEHPGDIPDDGLGDVVGEWLTLPDLAERVGVDFGRARRLVRDRHVVAVRQGENSVWQVPAAFVKDGEVIPTLRGTIVLLTDAGFKDHEIIRWLFEEEESLGLPPIEALRAGRRAEVRRVAQALF